MKTHFEEEDVDSAQIIPAERPEEEDVDVNIERVVAAASRIIAEVISPETRAA